MMGTAFTGAWGMSCVEKPVCYILDKSCSVLSFIVWAIDVYYKNK